MKFLVSLMTQIVVLDAKPTVKVESSKDLTKRELLSNTDQEKYRVRIIKNGTRYLWASRENRELVQTSQDVESNSDSPRNSLSTTSRLGQ